MANWNDLFIIGVFVPTFLSGTQEVSIGASGAIITLTPPTDERVLLSSLLNASVNETDIKLTVGADDLITNTLNYSNSTVGKFAVGQGGAGTVNEANTAGTYPEIMGGVNEVIVVTKTTGTTGAAIKYAYQFGVLK